MEENDLEKDFLEKTLASGDVITLYLINHVYSVDCWDEDGEY